jgi:hypothetical protein
LLIEEASQMKYVTTIERMAKEEGKIEEKQAIALNMLREHIPLEMIARTTSLTIEQVQALQAQLEQN